MKRVPKLDAKLFIVPHDGGTNPHNPYDQLTPKERQEKIVQLCARIYLRLRARNEATPGKNIVYSSTREGLC